MKKTKQYDYNEEYIETKNETDNSIKEEIETKEIVVHITGSIKNEGIIKLKEGARISDAIEMAGGTAANADLSKVNLAYILSDGQKIYIPNINDKKEIEYINEDSGENVIVEDTFSNSASLVNINNATQAELETLSGVGPSTALKIIEYRKKNGDFEKIEDIQDVTGIGESKFNAMKDSICVK